MTTSLRFFSGLAVLSMVLFATPSTAQAAKGVKKVAAVNVPRTTSGKIIGIDVPDQIFRLQSVQTVRNNIANGGPPVLHKSVNHDYSVTPSTVVVGQNGKPLPQSALQMGVRVKVLAIGNQASKIMVYTHSANRGHVYYRYRPHSYHPHHHYSNNMHHLHANHHRRK